MTDRVVYFSGVHGSGKSTLIKEIAKNSGFLEHERIHSVILDDTYIRAVWRLTKYYIEAREQSALAEINQDKLILGNRCVYDNFAYMAAFQKLGWVSNEEINHHSGVFEALFPETIRPKMIIHIAPPLDWVKDRLNVRWQSESKKWREDDFEYLKAVMCSYDALYENLPKNVFRLKETDYDKRIEQVLVWLKEYKK